MTKHNRHPVPFTAADGTPCLGVPLAGDRGAAIIEADALPLIHAAGLGAAWSFNSNGKDRRYVRGSLVQGNTVTVARVIAGARSGQCVCHRDGNPLNLRRMNLYLIEGKSKMDCVALIGDGFKDDRTKLLSRIFAAQSDNKRIGPVPPAGQRAIQHAAAWVSRRSA